MKQTKTRNKDEVTDLIDTNTTRNKDNEIKEKAIADELKVEKIDGTVSSLIREPLIPTDIESDDKGNQETDENKSRTALTTEALDCLELLDSLFAE